MRILVADDDRNVVHLVASLLRGKSHQVVPAFDAMQAFMFAMQRPMPDVVILDVNIPGGTGIGVLKRLKSSLKTALIPVIILSGATGVETELKEGGADAFLDKPLDPAALFATLDKLRPAA